jgi:hypothetical protein
VSASKAPEVAQVNKNIEMAFQFAQDTAKHLVTLATGTIAFTVTFADDFLHAAKPTHPKLVVTAWIALLGSVVFGQWSLMALTGRLTSSNDHDIYHPAVLLPSVLQVLCFAVGLGAVVIFAIKSLP